MALVEKRPRSPTGETQLVVKKSKTDLASAGIQRTSSLFSAHSADHWRHVAVRPWQTVSESLSRTSAFRGALLRLREDSGPGYSFQS
eukprot:891278-Rhodomonas_salina.2